MALGLIAKKVGMSRVFTQSGEAVAVTYLKVDDNVIVRMKTKEKDGYIAVVLGIGEHVMRTRKGKEVKKFKEQKEFIIDSLDGFVPGGKVTIEKMPAESMVRITSTSKGKGFQGVVKRWHFAGGPASHGSHFKREPGSVGMRTWPGRIHAGKRMAGHMGLDTVTLRQRPVIVSDAEKKVIGINGPVPGPNGATVYISLEPNPRKPKAVPAPAKPAKAEKAPKLKPIPKDKASKK